MNECYLKVLDNYKAFKGKQNESNKIDLLLSLKQLNKAIYKFKSTIKNIYFGDNST